MSMLELITKAASANNKSDLNSQYPILLNPDPILLNLKPNHADSFLKPVDGWKISQTDSDIIELSQKFCNKLKIKSQNPKSFTNKEFLTMFNSYLQKNAEKAGISIGGGEAKNEGGYTYTNLLVQKAGFLMGDAVLGLVLEACFAFELWEVLESLIVNGSCCKDLVCDLIDKRRADLVCFCVKYVSDLGVNDVLSVLKFFLSPAKDAYATMVLVRKEWERETVSAFEMAMDKSLSDKKVNLAKDAAVLLTMAYDQFTTSELCLHYLLASPNVDDVIFSACIGKLNGAEIMGLVRYLNKWLGKYQKFPQACSSSSAHGLKAFELVPSLEQVTKCFGLVIDEHFSSLVILPEFREEVKSIELVVSSLASEARLCCTLANLTASLKN